MDGQMYHLINKAIRREQGGCDDIFFGILDGMYRRSRIRIADMVELINCLDEVIEMRNAMSAEVENLVYYCFEENIDIYKLIYLLTRCNSKFHSNPGQAETLRYIITSVYAGIISIDAALSTVQKCLPTGACKPPM